MFDRLDEIESRFKELNEALASPEIVQDPANYQKTAKAQSELLPIVEKYQEYKKLKSGIADSRALMESESDAEMRAYAEEELHALEQQLEGVQ
jgi:peptide chain release factor 1